MSELSGKTRKSTDIGAVVGKYGIYLILIALIIICSFISPNFMTLNNVMNVLRQISVIAIIALAEMILMVDSNICLSAGSQLCMAGLVAIYAYLATESMIVAVIVGILVGGVLGAVNGLIASFLGVSAFITTLATSMIFRGMVNIYTKGQSIAKIGNFSSLGQGYVGVIPIPVIIMLICVVLMGFVLKRTILGRRLLAIGGNVNAARASGINVKMYCFIAFVFSGALTGLAGVIHLSRLNMGSPTAGQGYEMDAIAGAVIGGTSMEGGSGSAFGVLIGSMMIGVINNIMNLMNITAYAQDIIKGIIIIVAILVDLQTKKKYR